MDLTLPCCQHPLRPGRLPPPGCAGWVPVSGCPHRQLLEGACHSRLGLGPANSLLDGPSGDGQDLPGDGGFITLSAAFRHSHAQSSAELPAHWATEGGAVVLLGGHTRAGGGQADVSRRAALRDLREGVGGESRPSTCRPGVHQRVLQGQGQNLGGSQAPLRGHVVNVLRLGLGLRVERNPQK